TRPCNDHSTHLSSQTIPEATAHMPQSPRAASAGNPVSIGRVRCWNHSELGNQAAHCLGGLGPNCWICKGVDQMADLLAVEIAEARVHPQDGRLWCLRNLGAILAPRHLFSFIEG
ncbi:hypothetical protein, partial [Salipiger pallidus]|uniref:hypothetical protein n=1 Tax=Salipiger pallidus TaxID=1775170 RepID=UPI001E5EA1A5